MTRSILKSVAAGLLIGLALFALPFFLLRIFIFFVLIRLAIGLLWKRRSWHDHSHGKHNCGDWRRAAYSTEPMMSDTEDSRNTKM